MKKFFVTATFAICFLLVITRFAQSTPILDGAAWLSSSQKTDGSWGAQPDLAFVYSAEAISALKSSVTGSVNYSSGMTWLTSQDITSIDEASRKIISLASGGIDVSELINGLISSKNSDGGWGYNQESTSAPLDTALALQALKAANYSDATVLYQAINFLTTNQNSDGGWGFRSANGMILGDASNAYVTAHVLRALASYSSTFSVQSSIQKAGAYLLSKQNADGGFGSSPLNVYEAALAFLALIESGQGSVEPLQNAINYFVSTQSSNGSWNDDPYSTALALQALAQVKPNLTVASSDIILSKSIPQDGETVTITANIRNTGIENASNIIVRFFQGYPRAGGIQIGTDQVIQLIALGSSSEASVTTSFSGTGSRTVFVQVDPDNLVSETTIADNIASARLWIATAPDLAVFSEDLQPSSYVPSSGTAFTLEYKIRNLGESETGPFAASLYDGNPSDSGVLLQTINISGIAGGEVRTGTVGVTLSQRRRHALYLVADSGSQTVELSETNTGNV